MPSIDFSTMVNHTDYTLLRSGASDPPVRPLPPDYRAVQSLGVPLVGPSCVHRARLLQSPRKLVCGLHCANAPRIPHHLLSSSPTQVRAPPSSSPPRFFVMGHQVQSGPDLDEQALRMGYRQLGST